VAGNHDIVGFSSTFMQTRTSLRLAQEIRQLAPETRILLGGSNACADMGRALLERFDCLDLVCHGEGDEIIERIVRSFRGVDSFGLGQIRGISYREGDRLVDNSGESSLPDMERIPVPDFQDYFTQVRELELELDARLELPVWLPVETARGCWWGAKKQCTFCGLNSDRMLFRSKNPDRVFEDLDYLHETYDISHFFVVDNILGHDYFDTLLKRLKNERRSYSFHWELKANLKRRHVEVLADSGAVRAQPGIESLSTPVLRVMKKGVTAIQNIQTLKWLTEFGIKAGWNFLCNFPGEKLEWYEDAAELIPNLMHLQPPNNLFRISVQRFSPYFERPDKFGIQLLGPTVYYRYAFGDLPSETIERLAYEFDYAIHDRDPAIDDFIEATLGPLISRWREEYEERGCTLSIIDGPAESLLVRGPLLKPDRLIRVRGKLRRLLRDCEHIQSERSLMEMLSLGKRIVTESDERPFLNEWEYWSLLEELCSNTDEPEELSYSDEASSLLEKMEKLGLILGEEGKFLALPVNQIRLVRSVRFQYEMQLRKFV
jgi:ribosomal peptide maturation radical SAM protein 1